MPKLAVSAEQKMNDAARELIDIMAIRSHTPRLDISKKLDVSYPTFRRRYADPGTITIKELRCIIKLAKPSDEEILKLLKAGK